MEVFEIHITGDESILNKALALGLKTISVELLRPDKSVIRTEHMTSAIKKFQNYSYCKEYVDGVVDELNRDGVKIIRVKIESPFYRHYKDQSLYMEAHFVTSNSKYALSRNIRKTEFLGTEREYLHDCYEAFVERHSGKDIEICLHDTNVNEDKDWLRMYGGT